MHVGTRSSQWATAYDHGSTISDIVMRKTRGWSDDGSEDWSRKLSIFQSIGMRHTQDYPNPPLPSRASTNNCGRQRQHPSWSNARPLAYATDRILLYLVLNSLHSGKPATGAVCQDYAAVSATRLTTFAKISSACTYDPRTRPPRHQGARDDMPAASPTLMPVGGLYRVASVDPMNLNISSACAHVMMIHNRVGHNS